MSFDKVFPNGLNDSLYAQIKYAPQTALDGLLFNLTYPRNNISQDSRAIDIINYILSQAKNSPSDEKMKAALSHLVKKYTAHKNNDKIKDEIKTAIIALLNKGVPLPDVSEDKKNLNEITKIVFAPGTKSNKENQDEIKNLIKTGEYKPANDVLKMVIDNQLNTTKQYEKVDYINQVYEDYNTKEVLQVCVEYAIELLKLRVRVIESHTKHGVELDEDTNLYLNGIDAAIKSFVEKHNEAREVFIDSTLRRGDGSRQILFDNRNKLGFTKADFTRE